MSLIFSLLSFAQEISVQESKLFNLEKSYALEKSKLDSIQNSLEILLDDLNTFKKQEIRDNDKISALMAEAHLVSMQSDKQEKIVNVLAAQVKKERLILYNNFTVKIESLAQSLNNSDEINKKKAELELIELNQRRAKFSPALPLFSFDPKLIARINSSESKDELQKAIYLDYLSNALAEVDSNIAVIKSKEEEVSAMIRLDEQAEDFIDELDGTQFLSSIEIESGENKVESYSDNKAWEGDVLSADIQQIYEQLEPVMSELIEIPGIIDSDSLASDGYLKLLQGTEKTLKLYKKIIEDKMAIQ